MPRGKTVWLFGIGGVVTTMTVVILLSMQGASQVPAKGSGKPLEPAEPLRAATTQRAGSTSKPATHPAGDDEPGPFNPCGNEITAPPGC